MAANQPIRPPDPPRITPAEQPHLGDDARADFDLDPDVAFLNHGSFGATPRPVLAAQSELRARMERQPVRFLAGDLGGLLRSAASDLGAFLGTAGDNLVFVDNATAAVNAVLRSIAWNPGDEICFTNHGYGGVRQAIRYIADRHDVRPVEAIIPFPLDCPEDVLAAVAPAISPRTRLAVLDHITSPTGTVLPIERLIGLCRAQQVPVLVDGAHAPGMVNLQLDLLGADYYAGNCHKWLFAPKGCGFLWVHPSHQAAIRSPITSWGYREGYTTEFDWTGTKDPTPWLALPAAIRYYCRVPRERRQAYLRDLAGWAAARLARAWDVDLPVPAACRAALATLPLPGDLPATETEATTLHDTLVNRYQVEVPVLRFNDRLWTRISAQVYTRPADFDRLADAVRHATSA